MIYIISMIIGVIIFVLHFPMLLLVYFANALLVSGNVYSGHSNVKTVWKYRKGCHELVDLNYLDFIFIIRASSVQCVMTLLSLSLICLRFIIVLLLLLSELACMLRFKGEQFWIVWVMNVAKYNFSSRFQTNRYKNIRNQTLQNSLASQNYSFWMDYFTISLKLKFTIYFHVAVKIVHF